MQDHILSYSSGLAPLEMYGELQRDMGPHRTVHVYTSKHVFLPCTDETNTKFTWLHMSGLAVGKYTLSELYNLLPVLQILAEEEAQMTVVLAVIVPSVSLVASPLSAHQTGHTGPARLARTRNTTWQCRRPASTMTFNLTSWSPEHLRS